VFNQKSTKVDDISEQQLMPVIKQYRAFLIEHMDDSQFGDGDSDFVIDTRIKNVNSIEDKYDDYMSREEKGKVNFNKCFNDIFGIRATINCDEMNYHDVKEVLSKYKVRFEEKNQIHSI